MAPLIDGVEVVAIGAPDAGLEAAIAPGAGMVVCSLRHRGEEILGQRRGLATYARTGSTMGIPLLYPWANRLSSDRFSVAGTEVGLDPASPRVRRDENGLAMHGLLAGTSGWEIIRQDDAGVAAAFDFGAHPDLLAMFGFAHRLQLEVAFRDARLELTTTVRAEDGPVPVSFGFHPYLRLPGASREDWQLDIPVSEQLALDGRSLPTGARDPVSPITGALGERTFDYAFRAPEGEVAAVVSGGGRTITLRFDPAYPFMQVYAPAEDAVIAIEPMTAPTNALVSGTDLPVLAAGETFTAAFSVEVSDSPLPQV